MDIRAIGWLLAGCIWAAGTCRAWAADEWIYTVQPGDTLWSLSQRYLTDPALLPRLQARNGVANPRRLPPGLQLRIPHAWIRSSLAPVRLIAVRGAVRAEGGSAGTRTVQVRDEIVPGEILTTPQDGHALLQFQDGSRISLLADSGLRIVVARVYASGMAETHVELLRGRTENYVVPRTGQGVRFEIHTPAGVTSVRGTDYRVSADESARARTEVLDGRVAVDASLGGVKVEAGFGTVVAAGEAPRPPVRLLPPPDLSGVPARVAALPAELALPPVGGAQAYRVQLAREAAFESIVFDALETAARVRLPPMAAGSYFLRVRAVDDLGLEGRDARHAIELSAAPAPPDAVAPEAGEALLGDTVALDWRASSGITYRVQVARDVAFTELVHDVSAIEVPPLTLESKLPAGTYHWRVAARHPEQGEGPFGPSRTFRRIPRAPEAVSVVLSPESLRLGWASVEPQVRFRLEVAGDEAFSDMLAERVVDAAPVPVPRPAPGTYFARVRALGEDGFEGPYSEVLRLPVPPPPAPPVLREPAEGPVAPAQPVRLRWDARAGERYEVRIAPDDSSALETLRRAGVEGGSLDVETQLPPGRYVWQVAASTEQDGAGEYSPPRRLHIPPVAPVLDTPSADARSARLSWSSSVPAAAYRVQIARDAQFSEMIADAQVSDTKWTATGLAPGDYRARVQGLTHDGLPGPYSSTQTMNVPRRFPWWVLPILPLFLLLL